MPQHGENRLHRVGFRAVGRQPEQGDAVRYPQVPRPVLARPVQDHRGVLSGGDPFPNLPEVPVRPAGAGPAAHMPDRVAGPGAGGGERVHVSVPVVPRDAWARPFPRPDPGEHALPANARPVLVMLSST